MLPKPLLFACPCCGFHSLDEKPPGTFNICRVCGWEDDNVQFDDPDFAGGANELSLRETQSRWLKSVNAQHRSVEVQGTRFLKSSEWKPL
jgi:hypothetical protein